MGGSPRHAYVEEFNEEANTTLSETRQTANIAAKRSSRPDLGKLKTATPGRDEASDSGVSSHAGATVGSGNTSTLDSKTNSPKPVKSNAATTMPTTTDKEREKEKGKRSDSRSGSPKKSVLRKSLSHRTKQENLREKEKEKEKPCNCQECAAKMRLSGSPVQPKAALSHQASAQQATAAPSRPHTAKPPSPSKTSRSAQPQDIPVLQYPHQRPRPRTSHLYPSRPQSFHGGMSYPGTAYAVYQPPVFIPTGPPVPPPSYQPPPPPPQPMSYPIPPTLQTVPPRNIAYPYTQGPSYNPRAPVAVPQLMPDPYQSRRRSSFYDNSPVDFSPLQPAPAISYPSAPAPATYIIPQPVSRRQSVHYEQRPSPVSPPEDHFSLEEYYRHVMPPPAPPPAPVPRKAHIVQPSRPPISRSATTSVAHPATRHTPIEHEIIDDYERHERKANAQEPRSSTRPSMFKRLTSGRSGKQKETEVIDRRSSSTIRAPDPPTRSRDRPRSYHAADPREDVAEKYQAEQAAKRGVVPKPLAAVEVKQDIRQREQGHVSASRGSRTSRKSGSSDEKHGKAGSSRLSTERHRRTSELRSRRGEDEEFNEAGFTIRMEKEGNITLNFNGTSTDDRTIKWKPSKDDTGGVELSIVGNSAREGGRDRSSTRYSVVSSSRGSRAYRDLELTEAMKKLQLGKEELARTEEREEKDGEERVIKDSKEVRRPIDISKPLENDRIKRIQTTTTRSRRSSRSVVGRTPMEEGRPF